MAEVDNAGGNFSHIWMYECIYSLYFATVLFVSILLFYLYLFIIFIYVYRILWPLRLEWLLVWCLYKEVYLQIFKRESFWLHGCCGEWEGWARKPG